MNKALFNLPVMMTTTLSLAATLAISAWVFADRIETPTLLLDEPWAAPDFTVTDHNGKTVTKESMLGKVWVCDFFLTRCNGICPILGLTMADLALEISNDPELEDVMLISFSVDPEHDTVEQLQRYRTINSTVWAGDNKDRQAANDKHWLHVRAEEQAPFWELVENGFKLFVGPASPDDLTTPVAHASKLVLIDKAGVIRGYYEGTTEDEIPALLADIRRLVNE